MMFIFGKFSEALFIYLAAYYNNTFLLKSNQVTEMVCR